MSTDALTHPNGVKTWTASAGIADAHLVFALTGERLDAAHGPSAYLVKADNPGLEVLDPIVVSAPHPDGLANAHRSAVTRPTEYVVS